MKVAKLGWAHMKGVNATEVGAPPQHPPLQHACHTTRPHGAAAQRSAPAGCPWQADFEGADFSFERDGEKLVADLTDANFENASLFKADLRGVNLDGANFAAADLSNALLDGAKFPPCNVPAKAKPGKKEEESGIAAFCGALGKVGRTQMNPCEESGGRACMG